MASNARSPGLQALLDIFGVSNTRALLLPFGHDYLLERQRANVIITRVRLVALVFAVLTPLWIVVDVWVFPWPINGKLAIARLITSAAFFLLALMYRRADRLRDAWVALVLMFLIPTGFFLYSHPLLGSHDMVGTAHAMAAGYAFLPFVMLAGLSVFPLTALEAAAFAMPVLVAEAAVALMQVEMLGWTTHAGAFWLLLLITVVATLAGMSQLDLMAALVRRSTHDALTGCLNRGSGETLIAMQHKLSGRYGVPLSLVFLDIDHFKSINDRYGHEGGDLVLKQFTEALRRRVRETDALIRWGGEEFVIIQYGTHLEGARQSIERIFESEPGQVGLGTRPDGAPLTASVGIAERIEDRAEDWEALVALADRHMYRAKESGRARIVSGEE